MADIVGHAGGCCGLRTIHGFRDTEDNNIASLLSNLRHRNSIGVAGFENGEERIAANGNLLLEVILSNRQTEQYPGLIRELERLGFVYDAAWRGQHGTPVHRFSRARNRLRLADNGFNWAGMMMEPNVGGRLPTFEQGAPVENRPFQVGDRVRCTNPNSNWYILIGNVIEINRARDGGINDGIVVEFPYDQRTNIMAPSSFELYGQPAAAPNPNVVYRHPQLQQGDVEQPAAPAPEQRRIILTELFALFRDGRVRGPFENIGDLNAAYPLVRRYQRRNIWSDGDIVTTDFDIAR